MTQETIIVYFGCWNDSGHYLWLPNMQRVSEQEAWKLRIPKAGELDGSRLFLPRPEKVGTGSVTYLPAMNRTIFAWWGNNPWDERGAVNSAIIAERKHSPNGIWALFNLHFPGLFKQLKRPTTDY